MSKRKKKLQSQIGTFLQQYGRKARSGGDDPNDRQYDRAMERKIKRMKPEELDALIHGDESSGTPNAQDRQDDSANSRGSGRSSE